MKDSEFLGWSNEETMFAWGAVNPLGTMISKTKPSLVYNDRKKDTKAIQDFLRELSWGDLDKSKINIEELVNHLYRNTKE